MANYQPEDICNMSLDIIGFSRRIGDLQEGSKASIILLDLYGESRDECLRLRDWPFARRNVTLTPLKAAGSPPFAGGAWTTAYPPPGWLYEYVTPPDLILLRYIAFSPTSYPVLNPMPQRFTFYNDPTVLNSNGLPSRCILANLSPAICTYTGQILDPMTFEPLFINFLVQTLANKIKYALTTSPDMAALLAKEQPQEEAMAAQIADSRGP
jgi:hypothetical protein